VSTVVIDIGCARHGNDYSIERLIEEYRPKYLFGFDPHESIVDKSYMEGETVVTLRRQAAWLYDGEIGFLSDGLNSTLSHGGDTKVTCFDLARWLHEEMPAMDVDTGKLHKVVLKLDAEGSEYELLEHLINTGHDKLIDLAWVEFHPFGVENPAARRAAIEEKIACELVEWRF
jgi:hypothetical protein